MSFKESCTINTLSNRYELRSHGTVEFPCAGYFSDKDISWHYHSEIEIIFVKIGEIKVYILDDVINLKAGEGIFINSNLLHKIDINHNSMINSFVFHKNLISGSEKSIFETKYISPLINSNIKLIKFTNKISWENEIINHIIDTISLLKNENIGFEFLVREKISHIWYLIYINFINVITKKVHDNIDTVRLKKMLKFIHDFYGDAITLSDISNVANISERECLRCFKRTIKISPIQYLLKYRLSKASSMLKETDLSISKIGIICGFESPSNFTKHFKIMYNITPMKYRKIK